MRSRTGPPTVYWYSRGGVGGVQVFSQESAVTDLQSLFPRIQFFSNDQHITVIQVVHGLHDAWSLNCQRPTRYKTESVACGSAGVYQHREQLIYGVTASEMHLRPLKPSPFITVLVMWSSLKGATPSGARRSPAGLTSRFEPVMVILGSLGCRTITTAFMSGTERHESSPKHLTHTEGPTLTHQCWSDWTWPPGHPGGHEIINTTTSVASPKNNKKTNKTRFLFYLHRMNS